MIVKTYPLGSLQTNCYIAIDEDTNKAAIIDPGAQANYLIKEIEALGINIDVILLTHCHFDHDGAVTEL
ncbi:MAG: MBL fold metallo-hydrolase, partial [Clostridium sp.]